jgi:hypothetical protein
VGMAHDSSPKWCRKWDDRAAALRIPYTEY